MAEAAPQEQGTSSSRYTILGRIASGGMAEIYLALATNDAGVDRYLVLKRVIGTRSHDEVFAEMFLDEARLAAQLQHPNIAQVYDVGKLDGSYFFTMEYVHGETIRAILHRLVRAGITIPIGQALYVASCALAALHYAHEHTTTDGKRLDIVHRDVSPSNLMVGIDGVVKLLDFGVAKVRRPAKETRGGALKGKISYMSPEQCSGGTVDRRSDIFALGIVLYEMVTRKRLYNRDTDFNTMLAITSEPAPVPSSKRPDISPEVDRIILTALQKDPARRYQTAAEMLEDIEAVATAERYLMSTSAMGRFMREHIGDKPKPWHSLPNLEEPRSQTLITGPAAERGTELRDVIGLQEQLDHAPNLGGSGVTPAGTRSATMDAVDLTPVPATDSIVTGSEAPPSRRKLLLAGGVVVALLVVVIVILASGSADTVVAAGSGSGSVIAVTPPPAPDAALDAAASLVATPDAAPAPPSFADAVAKADWDTVLALCAAGAPQDEESWANCGVAACNRKQRDVAIKIYRKVEQQYRRAIEEACKQARITLADPRPVVDPCKDPKFVEANPLRCQ